MSTRKVLPFETRMMDVAGECQADVYLGDSRDFAGEVEGRPDDLILHVIGPDGGQFRVVLSDTGEFAEKLRKELDRWLRNRDDKFGDAIPLVRKPDGYINNCALANGVGEKDCQLCDGTCPDRERF